MEFNWHLFVRFLPLILEGFLVTLQYTAAAIVLSMVIGFIVGTLHSQRVPLLWRLFRGYTTLFRETPLLVQMYLIFYGLPYVGLTISAPVSGILAISLNEGAFVAEIVRGGIQSVRSGQKRAAISMGMSKNQVLRYVLLPQTIRTILPSLAGQSSYILKDTALLTLIAVEELTNAAQYINELYSTPGTSFFSAAFLYLVAFWAINSIALYLQSRQKWN
jgi:polar amino acid transport system permease protein